MASSALGLSLRVGSAYQSGAAGGRGCLPDGKNPWAPGPRPHTFRHARPARCEPHGGQAGQVRPVALESACSSRSQCVHTSLPSAHHWKTQSPAVGQVGEGVFGSMVSPYREMWGAQPQAAPISASRSSSVWLGRANMRSADRDSGRVWGWWTRALGSAPHCDPARGAAHGRDDGLHAHAESVDSLWIIACRPRWSSCPGWPRV